MTHLSSNDIVLLLVSLGILLAVARILGEIARRHGQPGVMGELIAGILLGPTILGRVSPELTSALFPPEGNTAIVMHGITTVAITLFLFVAGMEVELSTVCRRGMSAVAVAFSGLWIPFASAFLAAWYVPEFLGCEPTGNPFLFAAFFATAISISALPVIAKTLLDLRLYRTDFGMMVIAAAVFDDLAGWLIFAVILGMLGTATSHGLGVAGTVVCTCGFAFLMLTLGRRLLRSIVPWLQRHTEGSGFILGFVTALAMLSAAATEWIGIHAVFGAFLAGVAVGDTSLLRSDVRSALHDFVSGILAPLFFASVCVRLDVVSHFDPSLVVSVLAIACVGKIVGCSLTARLTGIDWNTSWAVGFAMNARGAMEIILGMVAWQCGLIGERMFVALIVMAVVTSLMSGPAISRLLQKKGSGLFFGPAARAERALEA